MKKKESKATSAKKKWSKPVNETSNAMDLDKDVFKSSSPEKIAKSLKHSAETSKRRKAKPFQSAMSMLNFYINRAGKNLSKKQLTILEKSKNKLRLAFGRDEKKAPGSGRSVL